MVLDPILGVDSSAVDLTAYQIPLQSSPILAPEWNPQGKYGPILHPDNIPTVFGTMQAFNNKKPLTAQALSTDGKKNLNVNVAGSDVSLSGGGSFIVGASHSSIWPGNFAATMNLDNLSPAPTKGILSVCGTYYENVSGKAPVQRTITLFIGSNDHTTAVAILTLLAVPAPTVGASEAIIAGQAQLSFPGYLDLSGIAGIGDWNVFAAVANSIPAPDFSFQFSMVYD